MSDSTLDSAHSFTLRVRGLSPSMATLSIVFHSLTELNAVRTPRCTHLGLGSSDFARHYFRNHCCFLFLRLLRCFSSAGSLCTVMYWLYSTRAFSLVGFPIQISADQIVFANPRSFSQLITSFFGSQCLGIHPMLLLLNQFST